MNSHDVTVVLNLHSEGYLAHYTIESIDKAIRFSVASGIKVQVVCILDCASPETSRIANARLKDAMIFDVKFGDLSESRNFGVAQATGKFTTFIDGDDLWGARWITEAFKLCRSLECNNYIIHPRHNMYFGEGIMPYYWVHPDMRFERIAVIDIVAANRWTSSTFALTSTYRSLPYKRNNLTEGFGYEDWLWNYETNKGDFQHITAPNTIHFIRTKMYGSLMVETNKKGALVRFPFGFEISE